MLRPTRLAVCLLASLTLAGSAATVSTSLAAQAAPAAHLGDLSLFRTIASDTLRIVETGDIKAARLRIKDLETGWDRSEATLRPMDKRAWLTIDASIDNALAALREPNPTPPSCRTALQELLTVLGKYQAA